MSGVVSVVLPVRNGMATLPALLDALELQRLDGRLEVVAVDSGSTDGSRELLRARADRTIEIRPHEFDHGATRNLGIEASSGELVVLLVQDALPADERFVAGLAAPLSRDPSLAGAFGRQLPRPDASGVARHYLARWIAGGALARRFEPLDRGSFDRMAPAERMARCALDNVASIVRRSDWEREGFPTTPIAEDLAWARAMLLGGRAIAFVPEAAVVHSHDRSPRYELARTRALHARLHAMFGLRTVPGVPHLLRGIAATALLHVRCHRRAPSGAPRGARELARVLALAVAWPLGQYLGGRDDARRGSAARRPPEA